MEKEKIPGDKETVGLMHVFTLSRRTALFVLDTDYMFLLVDKLGIILEPGEIEWLYTILHSKKSQKK